MAYKCKGSIKLEGKKELSWIAHCHIEMPARAEYILELNFFSADFLPGKRQMDVESLLLVAADTTSPVPLQSLNCFLETGSCSIFIDILCKNYIGEEQFLFSVLLLVMF